MPDLHSVNLFSLLALQVHMKCAYHIKMVFSGGSRCRPGGMHEKFEGRLITFFEKFFLFLFLLDPHVFLFSVRCILNLR